MIDRIKSKVLIIKSGLVSESALFFSFFSAFQNKLKTTLIIFLGAFDLMFLLKL